MLKTIRSLALSALFLAVLVMAWGYDGPRAAQADLGDYAMSEDFNLVAANTEPTGMTYDGTYFRVVDSDENKIFSYTSAGVHTSSADFDLPSANSHPAGVTFCDNKMWVTDRIDLKIYSYNTTGSDLSNFSISSQVTQATGLACDGTYLYVPGWTEDKVFAYTLSGTHTASKGFGLAADNGNPIGITWDGTDFLVADNSDDKAFTYNASGAHVATEDFSFTSPNSNASGITHYGDYYYVVDRLDHKVYAYKKANTAPSVSVSASSTSVAGGAVVTLTATVSDTESSNSDLTYAWTATPNQGTFSSTTVASPTWTAPAATATAQSVTLTLVVTDPGGLEATDSETVTVQAQIPNTAPSVSVSADPTTVEGGGVTTLTAIVSDVESANNVLTYAWTAAPSSGVFSATNTANTTWTAPAAALNAAEDYVLTLSVTDPGGLETTAAATVSVSAANPTVTSITARSVGLNHTEVTVVGEKFGAGSPAPPLYRRHRAGSAAWSSDGSVAVTSSPHIYTVESLTDGTSYTFSASFNSDFSDDVSVTHVHSWLGEDQDFDLTTANAEATGVAWDGTHYYVLDSGDTYVYAYSASGVYSSTQSFDLDSANGTPQGITWDGSYLRVADYNDAKVYAYTNSGTYTSGSNFDLISYLDPAGIAWDGTNYYILDSTITYVYVYSSSGTYSIGHFDLNSANASPRGITWDGSYLRVVDHDDAEVYTYTSSGTYTSGSNFDLDSANTGAEGITWDGAYLRVVGGTDTKVYSYGPPNTAPSVSVSADPTTVDGGGVTTLTAIVSDVESANNVLTYAWTAAPSSGVFSATNTANTTWTAPAAALNAAEDYVLTLSVTDPGDLETTAAATVSVSAANPTVTSITARSVGLNHTEVTVVGEKFGAGSPAPPLYRRHRAGSAAWSSDGSVAVTSSPHIYTVGSLTDGTSYTFSASFNSDFSDDVSVTHVHSGTTILLLDLVNPWNHNTDIWQVTNLADVENSDSKLGTLPAGLRNLRTAEEYKGWFYVVHNGNRGLWRSRTPTALTGWIKMGTLPGGANDTHSLFLHDDDLWGATRTHIYRIPDPTSPGTALADVQRVASNITRMYATMTIGEYLYVWDHDGLEFCRVSMDSLPGTISDATCNSLTGASNLQVRASTLFHGRIIVNEENSETLYEITDFDTSSPLVTSLGGYDSAANLVNAIGSWSGHPATIVSSATAGTAGATSVTVTVTLTAAAESTATTYVRHRIGTAGWTTASVTGQTGTTVPISLTGLSVASDYEYQASTDSNFPADDRATGSFTTTDPRPTLNPAPSSSYVVGSNASFTFGNVGSVSNIEVVETQGAGDLTLHNAESSLDCTSQRNSVSVSSTSTVYMEFCGAGDTSVSIRDAANTSNSRSYTFSIAAANNAPVFADATVEFSVNENVRSGTEVGTVTATDADQSDTIVYSLSGTDASSFSIDSSAGTILISVSPDFETKSSYSLTVTATDDDSATDSIAVTVTVVDQDDDVELFPSPSLTYQVGTENSFAARAAAGSSITSITVALVNAGGTATMALGQSALDCTRIATSLTVARSTTVWLKWCTVGVIRLTASEAGNSSNVSDYNITIGSAPSLTISAQSVAEDESVGHEITSFTATDADGSGTISYVLSGTGNDDFVLERVGSTNEIKLKTASSLDYETTDSYSLTVTATDVSELAGAATFTVTVTDVEERPDFETAPSGWNRILYGIQRTSFSNVSNISNVRVWKSAGAGNVHLSITSAGTSACQGTIDNDVTTTANDDIWLVFCQEGSVTLRMADAAITNPTSAYYREYTFSIGTNRTVPGVPTGLAAEPGNNSLALSWQEPADTGNTPITDYEYCTFADCSPSGTWASMSTTAVTATITQSSASSFPAALSNGSSVTLRIRAVNSEGNSSSSSTVTATPRAPSAPAAPTSFAATDGLGNVGLSWTAPSVAHDETITRYEYSSDNGSSWRTTGSTSTSYTATQTSASSPANLSNGTSYTFRVRAVNAAGSSPASGSDAATPYAVPGAPTGLQGGAGNAEVVLSWTAAPANGRAITRYEYSSDNGSNWRTTGSTSTSYTATQTSASSPANLSNGTSYTFRVRAVNSAGAGAASSSINVAPTSNTAPSAPGNFTIVSANNALVLSWNAPGDGGLAISDYLYCTFADCAPQGAWASLGTTGNTATITQTSAQSFAANLDNNYSYSVRIRAVNSIGNGAIAGPVSGTPRAPPQVSSVSVRDEAPTTVTLVATLDNTYNQSITVYARWKQVGTSNWTALTAVTTTSAEATWGLDSLTAGVAYEATASKSSSFGQGLHDHQWSQQTTVELTPDPATLGPHRLSNHELTPSVSAGVSNVDITLTETAGNITLATSESGLDCSSQTNSLTVAASGSFWFRACTAGSMTITATDADDAAVDSDYTMTIAAAAASISSVSVGSITGSTATITATLSNPDSQSTTVYCRWQTPPPSGVWIFTSHTTASTSEDFDITALTGNSIYAVECSLASTFANPVSPPNFTTSATPASVSSINLGTPTSDGVSISVTLSNPHSQATTVYSRYRTPAGSGAWTTGSTTSTSGTSATIALSGLDRATEYRVQVSGSSTFASSEEADFTTAQPTVSAISVGTISLTGAVATLTISNADGDSATFYVRYRTPVGSGNWTEASVATTGASVDYTLASLTAGSEYRFEASHDNTFPSASTQQEDFTTVDNSAPSFVSATATRQVDENTPAGLDVGLPVTGTDADVGDTITYSLSGTNAASFAIGSSTGQITVGTGTVLDYETKTSYAVTVTATDSHSGTGTVAVTIEVLDVDEVGFLGSLTFTIGDSGTNYGYSDGNYGALLSGNFPSALFDDDTARTVAKIYESSDGTWHFEYSGGTASEWLSDLDALDAITVVVKYEDRRDTRSFVLGGFVVGEEGTNGLEIDPPIPSRDWESKDGEDVIMEFHRHLAEAVLIAQAPLVDPVGTSGSFVAFLAESTPGGPIMAQTMIVIIVSVMFTFAASPTPKGVMMAAIVLVMTPWIPVLFGFGSTMAAVIVLVNVAAGAFSYKVFAARTE